MDAKAIAERLKVAAPAAINRDDEGNPNFDYIAVIRRYKEKVRNPLTAIRAKCVECSGGSLKEVKACRVETCALWPMRLGVNPFHKKARDRMAAGGDHDTDTDTDEEGE